MFEDRREGSENVKGGGGIEVLSENTISSWCKVAWSRGKF